MWACPTEALVMFPEASEPPPLKAPAIDDNYQTAIPGQYLIGEVAGKPLVKNAANLGRAVIEHMLQNGLHQGPSAPDMIDVLIVGSGPGGMSAALTCKQRGLSYLIIEKENIISSTVSRYPKGKLVMAEPYETRNLSFLPIFDSTKEELVGVWKQLAQNVDLQIRMHETVQSTQKQSDGSFLTVTTGGQYRSQRVVLATGTRGKPRSLGVPGEQYPKVESLLEDPDDHRGKAVCVVGGGDSALEAALALSQAGAKVILSYRGRSFHRAQAKNRHQVDQLEAEGRIKLKLQSEVVEFGEDTVTLQMDDGTQKRYPNQAAFVLIGADPPVQWLSTLGVHYLERPHMAPMPASDALVSQVVSGAVECPENAQDAAALISGRHVASPRESARNRPSHKASVGRRFVRSASSLFGLGDDRDKRPIPLSEFVGRARNERPKQRDQLEPGERTRILRMLRDEGGRQADEDSQVYRVADIMRQNEQRPLVQQAARPVVAALPPLMSGHTAQAPKQAVIVGLARATASGPVRKPVKRRHVAPAHEEKTRHFSEEAAGELLDQNNPDSVTEESTNLMDFDPVKIMREAAADTPLYEGSVHDEATRNVNVDKILQEGLGVQDDNTDSVFEEKTRIVDGSYEPRSLSEVEWDLD